MCESHTRKGQNYNSISINEHFFHLICFHKLDLYPSDLMKFEVFLDNHEILRQNIDP